MAALNAICMSDQPRYLLCVGGPRCVLARAPPASFCFCGRAEQRFSGDERHSHAQWAEPRVFALGKSMSNEDNT